MTHTQTRRTLSHRRQSDGRSTLVKSVFFSILCRTFKSLRAIRSTRENASHLRSSASEENLVAVLSSIILACGSHHTVPKSEKNRGPLLPLGHHLPPTTSAPCPPTLNLPQTHSSSSHVFLPSDAQLYMCIANIFPVRHVCKPFE